MISWAPIWAVVLRHLRMLRRDPNFLLGGFYWPVLDVLIWGFLGTWVQRSSGGQFPNYEMTALLALLLWQVVGRGCNFMAIALSEELWSHNIMNLFSLPLRIAEWMTAVIIFAAIMIGFTTLLCLCIIYALYDISMYHLITTFLIFFPPMFLASLWVGFTCLQIIITLGKRGTELGFVVVWFFMPFSAAFYPVDVLPWWGQIVSKFLPMSYILTGMRGYVMHQQDPTAYLLAGYGLGLLYATGAMILFVHRFKRSLKKGLARLAD